MPGIQKAIVAVVGAAVAILAVAEIDVDETTVTAVVTLLTAAVVYFVPNHPA